MADTIVLSGLTKGGIDRLARKAGVLRLSNFMYDEVRGITDVYMEQLTEALAVHLTVSDAVTVQEKHVHLATKSMGAKGHSTVHHGKISSCPSKNYDTKLALARAKAQSASLERQSHIVSKIEYYQKSPATCFAFAKTAFAVIAREYAGAAFKTNVRFSHNALELMQLDLESYLTHLLQQASYAAQNAKRKTVQPKDIQLVLYVTKMRR